MNEIKLVLVFFILQGCNTSEIRSKSDKVKTQAIEKGIYEEQLIFLSYNKKYTEFSYPNIKLYDSIGNSIQVGNCMNAIEGIINKISSDTFKYFYTSDLGFTTYVDTFNIISVDDLKKPLMNKNDKFYLIYYWNFALELMSNKKDADEIFKIMKRATEVAKLKKIKLMYVHSPI